MSIETCQRQTTAQFHEAMQAHRVDMERAQDDAVYKTIQPFVDSIRETLKKKYPYSHLAVICGEQPYGPLAKPKVLGKRILARALQEGFGDVSTIELFANLDLVNSETGFYRLVVPTRNKDEGVVTMNVLSENLRSNGLTANGIVLPHAQISKQMDTIASNLEHHYPTVNVFGTQVKLDTDVLDEWSSIYQDGSNPNYAEAHIAWLTHLEAQIGLQLDHLARESELDFALLKNGGLEILSKIWKAGLTQLREDGHEPVSLTLTDQALLATPFNLENDGVRLRTEYKDGDETVIRAFNPRTKDEFEMAIDDIFSGQYGVSLKAVPRVILYSLAGIDGHITGGGSDYNYDARSLMSALRLPYFPIVFMAPTEADNPLSVVQYRSMALARKDHPKAAELVRRGDASLVDLLLSCRMEQIKSEMEKATKKGAGFSTKDIVQVPLKIGKYPYEAQ